jgi:hypothetical protein
MSGEGSAMKAAHAESTRRILVRPVARAAVIARNSSGRNVSPAAHAEGTASSDAIRGVRAADTSRLPAGTPRNSAPKHWSASGPVAVSTRANDVPPIRNGLAKKHVSSTGRTAESTTSSGSSESLRKNSMQCSSSRAADATCATSQWPVRFTSTTTGRAVLETSPVVNAYVVWRTKNATRGSVSSETTRTGFGELPTLWKKRRSECLLRVASLAAAISPRLWAQPHSGINTPLGEATP